MTFTRYWKIVSKRWKIIVMCMVLAGLSSYIVSRYITPIYSSTAIVQIALRSGANGSQSDYNGLLASNQLVQTDAELAISVPVLQEVATHYPGLTTDQLVKEVSSSIKLNTQLFEIDVQDPSSKRAAAIANDVASVLISKQALIAQQNNNRSQQQLQQDMDKTRQQIDAATLQQGQLQAQENALVESQRAAEAQAQYFNRPYQQDPQQLKQEITLNGQIAVLQAQLTRLQQHYTQWQTALAQLELTEAQSSSVLLVVQPAQVNPIAVRPQIPLYTGGGLLAGLLLGVLLAVLVEQLDPRVRSAEALTRLLDLPVLATIWNTGGKKSPGKAGDEDINSEAYRILRTNIGFAAVNRPLHSLLITSALPGEGKSFTAENLAVMMAKAGKTTLLIDADWHHPTISEKFDLKVNKRGLSDAVGAIPQLPVFSHVAPGEQAHTSLLSGFSLDTFTYAVAVPNLYVMPFGTLPANPSELLASKAMEHFFVAIANHGAEIVIFDAPPLLQLADTSMLASKVDATVIVVDATCANEKHLKRAKALLMKAGAQIIGCVVNKQRRTRRDDIYADYYIQTEEQAAEKRDVNNGYAPSLPEMVRKGKVG